MRKTPTQERSRALVEAVLDATARVLVEDGYDRASTNRIARRAGVSPGSLYQYFGSKADVVSTLGRRHVNQQMQEVVQHFRSGAHGTIEQLTRGLVEALVAAHTVDPELHRVLVTQTPLDVVSSMRHGIEVILADDMRTRRAAGENRVDDPELAAFLVVAAVDGAITSALVRRPELLHDGRLVDGLTELICRYVLPSPG